MVAGPSGRDCPGSGSCKSGVRSRRRFYALASALLLTTLATGAACSSTSIDDSAATALSGENHTFATTYDPNPLYACGYPDAVVQQVVGEANYFVALSAESYDPNQPMFCGRWVDIDIVSQCDTNAGSIDEGDCKPGGPPALVPSIQAVLVDRCPDAKKCVKGGFPDKHAENGQDITAHLDIAPAERAAANIGERRNYLINWRWKNQGVTAEPVAFIVQKASDLGNNYFRLGLMLPYGASRVFLLKNGEQELKGNGTQAQYTVNDDWQTMDIKLRVEDFANQNTCYSVVPQRGQTWPVQAEEKYYKATIAKIACPCAEPG
jgi:hypothetical protein